MFGVGTPEMIGIVLIIFLIYGPDKLPEMIKKVAGFIRQIKSMTDDVTNTVSKEIHRIERSTHFEEPKNLVERIDSEPTIQIVRPSDEQTEVSKVKRDDKE